MEDKAREALPAAADKVASSNFRELNKQAQEQFVKEEPLSEAKTAIKDFVKHGPERLQALMEKVAAMSGVSDAVGARVINLREKDRQACRRVGGVSRALSKNRQPLALDRHFARRRQIPQIASRVYAGQRQWEFGPHRAIGGASKAARKVSVLRRRGTSRS